MSTIHKNAKTLTINGVALPQIELVQNIGERKTVALLQHLRKIGDITNPQEVKGIGPQAADVINSMVMKYGPPVLKEEEPFVVYSIGHWGPEELVTPPQKSNTSKIAGAPLTNTQNQEQEQKQMDTKKSLSEEMNEMYNQYGKGFLNKVQTWLDEKRVVEEQKNAHTWARMWGLRIPADELHQARRGGNNVVVFYFDRDVHKEKRAELSRIWMELVAKSKQWYCVRTGSETSPICLKFYRTKTK